MSMRSKKNGKHAMRALSFILIVAAALNLAPTEVAAEFLTPLASSKVYGCSLDGKIHKVTGSAQSRELSTKELRKLIKNQNKRAAAAKKKKKKGRKKETLVGAIKKCKNGKLTKLDPCAELALSASSEEINAKVINGRICDWSDSPLVKIISTFEDASQESCSGAFVTSHVVLTAQHCIFDKDGFPATKVEVYLEDLSVVEPDDLIADPGYFDSNADLARYDIAALAFIDAQPVSRTLKLLSSDAELRIGEQALLAGFGRDEAGNPPGFDLLAGYLRITEDKRYSVGLAFHGYPGESGACTGDSGGPLLVERNSEWYIAGVASFGDNITNVCFPPNNIYYTKHSDCDVRDLFSDVLCEAPYHDSLDGACVFTPCDTGDSNAN